MTQDEFDTEQEYYETECDFSDFAPTVPMPKDTPVTFDEDHYPFDDGYEDGYYNGMPPEQVLFQDGEGY